MKYNDKHTKIAYNKQLSKVDEVDSSRSYRRKKEREFKSFSNKIILYVGKIWWDSLSVDTMNDIHNSWKWSHYSVDFEKWVSTVKERWKPEKSIYRNNVIDSILED